MNAITHCAAYSLFPKATFEDRVNLQLARGSRRSWRRERDLRAIAKYTDRGWLLIGNAKFYHESQSTFNYGKRWIADSHSWVLPLDISELQTPLPPDSFSLGSFNLFFDESIHVSRVLFSLVAPPYLSARLTINREMVYKAALLQELMSDNLETANLGVRHGFPQSLYVTSLHTTKWNLNSVRFGAIFRRCSTIAMKLCIYEKGPCSTLTSL